MEPEKKPWHRKPGWWVLIGCFGLIVIGMIGCGIIAVLVGETADEVKRALEEAPEEVAKAPPKPTASKSASQVPAYTVAKQDDISSGRTKRLRVRVIVDKDTDEDGVLAVAEDFIRETTSKADVQAMVLWFYHDPETVGGGYTIAAVEWAPEGEWGKAVDVRPGDYSRHEYTVKMGSATGMKPHQPRTTAHLSEAKRRQIFRELVEAEDRANREAEEKYPMVPGPGATKEEYERVSANVERNVDESDRLMKRYKAQIRKRYEITSEQENEIVVEGVSKSWPPH